MIELSLPMFIPRSVEEPGKVSVNQGGQAESRHFSDMYSAHLEEFLGLRVLNLLEHLYDF